jgi:multiple sugar transport system permease protein
VPNTDTATKPASPKKALTDRAVANLFLLPTILLLVAMNIFPLFWSLGLSFTKFKANTNKPAEWIGNANYTEMMSREQVWQSFTTTAAFVLLAVGLQLAVGFGLAIR